ncbi:phage tail sheath subtilisin-like domain-containing protein [Achromobacter xylosoxidans]|uniref:phage tail sheath subtilisin-like domain-containing protein n=1 Tax=Alcaligenes xylosoxydans xylosoxydans TaxID=85698 RepID=UPI001F0D3F7A|nr:phage tail sheath subtilisin-like domain-containing protein [Achromobacter xylosoxidans]MCH4576484.1 phage tail sheath subtilisin-like domain-containing protein [Achromobacter xylosoxidans]
MADVIQLDQIPVSTRKPGVYFEFNTKLARQSLPTNEQRILMYAQRLSTGMVPALKVVDVFSDKDAAVYFGNGSMAHRMAINAIEANPNAQIAFITVDDAVAGQAAEAEVEITAAATGRGILTFQVGPEAVDVALETGMTAAEMATAVAAAVNDQVALPVTATAAAGKIKVTAKHKGESGNQIKVAAVVRYSTGATNTVKAQLAGGMGDPDLRPAYAAAFGSSYEIRVCPFATQDALLAFRDHLEDLGSPLEQRDAIGVAGFPGTLAAASTVASVVNSQIISFAWYNKSKRSSGEIAAGYAAVMASEEHPARPLNYLEIKGLDIIDQEDYPGRKEQENALFNGVTPLVVGPGNRVQIVRAISTYLVDAQNIKDDSCLDITVFRTLHYFRKACRQAVALRFPRELLSEKTPPKVRTVLLQIMYQCEDLEILQLIDTYKDRLVVQKHQQNKGMCVAAIPAPIVHGMHVFAGRIDLYV